MIQKLICLTAAVTLICGATLFAQGTGGYVSATGTNGVPTEVTTSTTGGPSAQDVNCAGTIVNGVCTGARCVQTTKETVPMFCVCLAGTTCPPFLCLFNPASCATAAPGSNCKSDGTSQVFAGQRYKLISACEECPGDGTKVYGCYQLDPGNCNVTVKNCGNW